MLLPRTEDFNLQHLVYNEMKETIMSENLERPVPGPEAIKKMEESTIDINNISEELTKKTRNEVRKELNLEPIPKKLITLQITGVWGDNTDAPSDRGYFGQAARLTDNQINGEFRFALNQFLSTIKRLHEESNPNNL